MDTLFMIYTVIVALFVFLLVAGTAARCYLIISNKVDFDKETRLF